MFGILDVKTQELTPFNPEHFITSSLPITYDKQAQCPKILKFLTEVLGENQLPLIQEGFGYCLYKDMPFHKIFMLVGDGANGKSTLLELLKRFLGSENVSNVTLQGLCENRFSIAQLYNKMANISADLPSKKLWQTGTLKMLTGNDTVTAEEKFKQPFSFKNPAKLFFSTNKIPETTDDTPAFFRRWVLIVCNNVFVGKKCDPHIIDEITTKEELSGLLNWSLEGLDRLLKKGRFSTTENLEDIRNEYIRKSNSAKAYIEENLVYENDPAAIIPANELYSKYVIYCQKQELPSMPKRSFTQNMEQWLPQAKNTTARINNKVIRVWQFVKIVTDVTEVLPKHQKSLFLEGQSVKNKEKVVTDGEVKKNGKVCLSGVSVTSVTNSEPTTCAHCYGPLADVFARDDENKPVCLMCEKIMLQQREGAAEQ